MKNTQKPIKKLAETIVREYLEKSGYNDSIVEININSNGDEKVAIKLLRNGGRLATLNFEFKEYAFCCGMKEIGNIGYSNINVLPTEKWKILIKKAIKQVIENNQGKDEYDKEGQQRGFSFTFPINDQSYRAFEDAMIDLHFQLVGQFTNVNSGNDLKHYILI